MFTAMYDGLVLKRRAPVRGGTEERDGCRVRPSETAGIAEQNVAMFLSRLTRRSDEYAAMTSAETKTLLSTLNGLLKLLSVLDKHLEHSVDRDNEDVLNRISGHRHSDELKRILSVPIENARRYYVGKQVVNRMRSLSCLFTWNLEKPNKDLVAHILRKYGNYNLDISVPVFTFDRYLQLCL